MKKPFILTFIILFSFTANAQEGGIGISYGTEVSKVALNIQGNKGLTEKLFISLNANFFMPEKEEIAGVESCSALTTVNLDAQFRLGNNTQFFPLAGVSYARIGAVTDGTALDSEASFGFNIGAGVKLGNIHFLGKYNTSDAGQLVFTATYVLDLGD